jgi:hypothetical protein
VKPSPPQPSTRPKLEARRGQLVGGAGMIHPLRVHLGPTCHRVWLPRNVGKRSWAGRRGSAMMMFGRQPVSRVAAGSLDGATRAGVGASARDGVATSSSGPAGENRLSNRDPYGDPESSFGTRQEPTARDFRLWLVAAATGMFGPMPSILALVPAPACQPPWLGSLVGGASLEPGPAPVASSG